MTFSFQFCYEMTTTNSRKHLLYEEDAFKPLVFHIQVNRTYTGKTMFGDQQEYIITCSWLRNCLPGNREALCLGPSSAQTGIQARTMVSSVLVGSGSTSEMQKRWVQHHLTKFNASFTSCPSFQSNTVGMSKEQSSHSAHFLVTVPYHLVWHVLSDPALL